MKDLQEFIKECLIEKGYDGLYCSGEECACETSDLFPCDEPANLRECHPGYKYPADADSEFDFMIGPAPKRDPNV
jgi:hypothetical protein